jgi:hypothetical protein
MIGYLHQKSLFAYDIEALVPSLQSADTSQAPEPQKLNGSQDVHFFSIGVLSGRTLVVYAKMKGVRYRPNGPQVALTWGLVGQCLPCTRTCHWQDQ